MASITRRTFIELVGATGAFYVSGCSEYPGPTEVHPVAPGWNRGEERHIPSTCLQCPSRCGIMVRVFEGRAVKIDGNPEHPLNLGRICPKGQAGLQVIYDPDRIRGPIKKVGGRASREYVAISWEQAIEEVAAKLAGLRNASKPHAVLALGGRFPWSMRSLFTRFTQAYGTPNLVDTSSLSDAPVTLSNELTQGIDDHLGFDLENTNYLICFGANILEAWRPTTYLLRMWGLMRRGRVGARTKIVVIDPRHGVGASKADEWIPIRPGTDGAFALGMAHVMISEGIHDEGFVAAHCFGFESWIEPTPEAAAAEPPPAVEHKGFRDLVLAEYPPERVAEITGVPAETIVRIAREFAASAPAVAAAGRGVSQHTNGLFSCMAIHGLNALAGSIDTPGGVIVQREPPFTPPPAVVEDETARTGLRAPRIDGAGTERFPLASSVHAALPDRILKGEPYPVEAALVYYTNPVFSGPHCQRYREALEKIPYIVSFSPFMDETTEHADIVLPDCTYLERLELDVVSPSVGRPVLCLRQPVVDPFHDTRNTGDVLLEIAHQIGGSVGEALPWRDFESYLKALLPATAEYEGGSFSADDEDEFFAILKEKGVWSGEPYRFGEWTEVLPTPSGKFELFSQSLKNRLAEVAHRAGKSIDALAADLELRARGDELYMPHFEPPRFGGDPSGYPFHLNTFKTMMHAEGRGANVPWLQESFGVQLIERWRSWLAINPESARKLGIEDGDTVWVESPLGRMEMLARFHPGTHPGVVSIPFEYGHSAYGRWASRAPGNPNEITSPGLFENVGGSSALYATRVRVYRG